MHEGEVGDNACKASAKTLTNSHNSVPEQPRSRSRPARTGKLTIMSDAYQKKECQDEECNDEKCKMVSYEAEYNVDDPVACKDYDPDSDWDSEAELEATKFSYQIRCGYCNLAGHWAPECPDIVCHSCSGRGHIASTCEQVGAERRQLCYYCTREGHEVRQCSEVRCHTCWSKGHIMRDCRVPWLTQVAMNEEDSNTYFQMRHEEKLLEEDEWKRMKEKYLEGTMPKIHVDDVAQAVAGKSKERPESRAANPDVGVEVAQSDAGKSKQRHESSGAKLFCSGCGKTQVLTPGKAIEFCCDKQARSQEQSSRERNKSRHCAECGIVDSVPVEEDFPHVCASRKRNPLELNSARPSGVDPSAGTVQ